MKPLLDDCPNIPFEVVRDVIEGDLGGKLGDFFEEFDTEVSGFTANTLDKPMCFGVIWPFSRWARVTVLLTSSPATAPSHHHDDNVASRWLLHRLGRCTVRVLRAPMSV